jgi:hypothetical protein
MRGYPTNSAPDGYPHEDPQEGSQSSRSLSPHGGIQGGNRRGEPGPRPPCPRFSKAGRRVPRLDHQNPAQLSDRRQDPSNQDLARPFGASPLREG